MKINMFGLNIDDSKKLGGLLEEQGFTLADQEEKCPCVALVTENQGHHIKSCLVRPAWVIAHTRRLADAPAAMRRIAALRRTNSEIQFGQLLGVSIHGLVEAAVATERSGIFSLASGQHRHSLRFSKGRWVTPSSNVVDAREEMERVLLWQDCDVRFVETSSELPAEAHTVELNATLMASRTRILRLQELAPDISVSQAFKSTGKGHLTPELQGTWKLFSQGARVSEVLEKVPATKTLEIMQSIERLIKIGRLSPGALN